MDKYVVLKFGVDLNGNEYDTPIWEGYAQTDEEAINCALKERFPKPDDAEFMKDYLKAVLFKLN